MSEYLLSVMRICNYLYVYTPRYYLL